MDPVPLMALLSDLEKGACRLEVPKGRHAFRQCLALDPFEINPSNTVKQERCLRVRAMPHVTTCT